jgi:hypothetical protein
MMREAKYVAGCRAVRKSCKISTAKPEGVRSLEKMNIHGKIKLKRNLRKVVKVWCGSKFLSIGSTDGL